MLPHEANRQTAPRTMTDSSIMPTFLLSCTRRSGITPEASACSSIIRIAAASAGRARYPVLEKQYKQAIKDRYPAFLTFSPYGEKTPDDKSYIDLDPVNKDDMGTPHCEASCLLERKRHGDLPRHAAVVEGHPGKLRRGDPRCRRGAPHQS